MSINPRTRTMILIMTMTLFTLIGGSFLPPTTDAATTFIGSTVERVDPGNQTITFRSREGQSWTLGVADPDLLKKELVAQGDQVSIEVDPKSDKVIKIVRVPDQPQSGQIRSEQAQPRE